MKPVFGSHVTLTDGRTGIVTFVDAVAFRFVEDGKSWQLWEWVPLSRLAAQAEHAA